jgi:23S rRNA A2030 N6-methylase RlmJ
VFLINPPWTLAATLKATLPWLADVLASDDVTAPRAAPWLVESSESY